jgi:hypothetical protein
VQYQHGVSVVTRILSRQVGWRPARRNVSVSPWDDGSLSWTRRLWPRLTSWPSNVKIAPPIGTPPSASPARASSIATSSIACASSMARPPQPPTVVHGRVARSPESATIRADRAAASA